MAMFKRLKKINADYRDRRDREKAFTEEQKILDTEASEKEKRFLRQYNLERTNQPGRYIAADKVIDINFRNEKSVAAATKVLKKRDKSPSLRNVSKTEITGLQSGMGFSGKVDRLNKAIDTLDEFTSGRNFDLMGDTGGSSGGMDLLGGGGGFGDFNFITGESPSKPCQKKRNKTSGNSKRKSSTRRSR